LSRQWLVIVNPRSGGNRNRGRLAAMLAGLQPPAHTIVTTRYPGHAAKLAMAAEADGGVAAVGGDGTLFEILRGVDRKQQRIALIPAGRGNSLARDLGLLNGGGPLAAMHWEQTRFIDLLEVTVTRADGAVSTHLSASTVAVGYPAAVVLLARKLARLGRMSYAAAATVAATRPLHFGACVQYGDGIPRDVRLSGFIANNTQHLANFVVFRKASYCDGMFEVMEMDAGVVKQTMHNVSALSGTGVYEPYPHTQATRARLWLEAPQTLMLDGELFPDVASLDVRILPSALECNGPKARA
jgi:diacylglycerol kinase (ATP)